MDCTAGSCLLAIEVDGPELDSGLFQQRTAPRPTKTSGFRNVFHPDRLSMILLAWSWHRVATSIPLFLWNLCSKLQASGIVRMVIAPVMAVVAFST
jgi:hypothetical protein